MGVTDFPYGVSSFGVLLPSDSAMHSGDTYWVTSNTSYGSNSNTGKSSTSAFATLTYAISKCTASHGDIIYVKEGHAETLTATIALNKAGITIIGLGYGNNRPTFTVNAAINGLTVTAANQRIHNLKFLTGASSTIATKLFAITGGVGNCLVTDCHFQIAAATKMYHAGYVLGAVGLPVIFRGCVFENLSTVAIAGGGTLQKTALLIRTGDVIVEDCRFNDMATKKKNKWANCIKSGSTGSGYTASTHIVRDCVFNCRGVAVTSRAAAVSARLSIINCRGISTSSNTALANIFLVTYANMVDTYAVGAVNKRAALVPAATEA